MDKQEKIQLFQFMGYVIDQENGADFVDSYMSAFEHTQKWGMHDTFFIGMLLDKVRVEYLLNWNVLMAIAKQVKKEAEQQDNQKILNDLSEALLSFDQQYLLEQLIHFVKNLSK